MNKNKKGNINMIKEFVEQNSIKEGSLQYSAGKVHSNNGDYIIGYSQKGAEDTFSICQPVFDKDNNLLGYLGIGVYRSLNYIHRPHNIDIPCYYWKICNPTKHCKVGIEVFTYWQNFKEETK